MWRVLLAALLGAGGALGLLGPLGQTASTVGPGEVEVSVVPSRDGATVVALPPLGRVEATTHQVPVTLTARVTAVDIEEVQATTTATDPVGALRREVGAALPGLLRRLAARVGAVALFAGAAAAMLLPGRRWFDPVAGALGGAVVVGGILGSTWATYDIDAFGEPRFEGELQRVPALLRALERNLAGIGQIQDRVDVVSSRLAELYAASAGELPGGSAGEVAILHVSDLHLNPLGGELVVQLARDLGVDAVLDTGDVTTFGFPIEARFGELLADAPVPYYVVAGNHDSAQNRAQLAAIEGITVVDGEVVTIGDVRVLGIADPTFTASNEVSTEEANATKAGLTDEVRRAVRRARPDVLAVHDPSQAAEAPGEVPVVVAGHRHRSEADRIEGTTFLVLGSTGATGLGSFAVETAREYEAQVLRFRDGSLIAVDHLSMTGVDGSFRLERRLLGDEDQDPDGVELPGVETSGGSTGPSGPTTTSTAAGG